MTRTLLYLKKWWFFPKHKSFQVVWLVLDNEYLVSSKWSKGSIVISIIPWLLLYIMNGWLSTLLYLKNTVILFQTQVIFNLFGLFSVNDSLVSIKWNKCSIVISIFPWCAIMKGWLKLFFIWKTRRIFPKNCSYSTCSACFGSWIFGFEQMEYMFVIQSFYDGLTIINGWLELYIIWKIRWLFPKHKSHAHALWAFNNLG